MNREIGTVVLGIGAPDGGATPWSFSFGSDVITRIHVDYTGGASSTGLAFDNFNTNNASIAEPGTLALLGLGLAGLGLARRK